MKEADLLANFPRLWHMAEDGSWEFIQRHGLLSTSALLDLFGVRGDERSAIESARRPDSVKIASRDLGQATIRDNKPMHVAALQKCLADDIDATEWFEILNRRSFYWLSRDRLRKLLNARAYRDRPQTVLTVDTASLLAAHRDSIELSPINSGSTIYKPQPRGRDTFLGIEKYPFEERRKTRSAEASVAELVVIGGVPDIMSHLLAAHTYYKGEIRELWRSPRAAVDDGP